MLSNGCSSTGSPCQSQPKHAAWLQLRVNLNACSGCAHRASPGMQALVGLRGELLGRYQRQRRHSVGPKHTAVQTTALTEMSTPSGMIERGTECAPGSRLGTEMPSLYLARVYYEVVYHTVGTTRPFWSLCAMQTTLRSFHPPTQVPQAESKISGFKGAKSEPTAAAG